MRRQLARDMGVVVPSVRILDNVQLEPDHYAIRIKEVLSGEGDLQIDRFMVMDPSGGQVDLPGLHGGRPRDGPVNASDRDP